MTTQEYRRIQAERSALERLLAQLPASSVIERKGLEFRKKKVEDILASQQAPLRDRTRRRRCVEALGVTDTRPGAGTACSDRGA